MAIRGIVGKIERLIEMPCAPTPLIAVEAILPATLQLFTSFTKPTWKEELKLTTGGTWLHHMKAYVADAIESDGSVFAGLDRALFQVAEWIDKTSWWFFLASLALDFAANWTSVVLDGTQCQADSTRQQWSSLAALGSLQPGEQPSTWPTWFGTTPTGLWYFPSAVTIKPGQTARIAWAAKGKTLTGDPAPIAANLVIQPWGAVIDTAESIPGSIQSDPHAIVWGEFNNNGKTALTMEVLVSALQSYTAYGGGYCYIEVFGPH